MARMYIPTINEVFDPISKCPDYIISKRDLINFCENNVITKEIFEQMELSIPLGVDLLTELINIGNNDKYVQSLLRERKLKRIL